MAEIQGLLSRHCLVTLVGAVGVGKTSLSLQAGADLSARFPDGVWFVERAPLDRAELVGVQEPDIFEVLAGLVDKSLVVSLVGAGENRYRLLESMRAFALEKLGTGSYAQLARRHC